MKITFVLLSLMMTTNISWAASNDFQMKVIKESLLSRVSGEVSPSELIPKSVDQLRQFTKDAKSKMDRPLKEARLYKAISNARVQIEAQTGGSGIDHWYLNSVLEQITVAVNAGNYETASNLAIVAGGWLLELFN